MWIYQGKEYLLEDKTDPSKICGFVYLITNLETQKKYIGKKLFWSAKSKMLKGKKKKFKVESDWMSYYGSNEILRSEVKKYTPSKFKREILHLCYSKSECSYLETHEQFTRNVLLLPDEYYNEWITCKITRKHLAKLVAKLNVQLVQFMV